LGLHHLDSRLINTRFSLFLVRKSTCYEKNEEKILKELRKSQREALEARARYEALVVHSEHKLAEANAEVQRLNESYANENSTLKAKLARYESTSSALQQTAAMKDKELSQLRAHSDQLMERLSRAGV
jgi:chromosome segregation ATPase